MSRFFFGFSVGVGAFVIGLSQISSFFSCYPNSERFGASIFGLITVVYFIFVGTNFRGLNKNDTFVWFKIRGHSISFIIYTENYHFYSHLGPFRIK